MNLRHGKKIDQLGPSIYARWGRLDILVANAGILGPLSPLGHIKDSDWEQVIEINLNANWRLIRTLDPCLRKSPSARAIFLTSNAPRRCKAYWGPYSVSKAALEALVKTYASETENTPVNVNLLNPGAVATSMRAQAYPGEDQSLITKPDDLGDIVVEMAHPSFQKSGQMINFTDTISETQNLVG
jgi:NAD(P)-dependent dehydrogenase (short-subunit alcohol dehydrogenase family)